MDYTFDFVAKFYPDFYSSDEIARNDDLHKLIDKEQVEGDCAHELLIEEYGGDIDNPQIHVDMIMSDNYILERAINNYWETVENTRTVPPVNVLDNLIDEGLTIEQVIDVVIERNSIIGVGLITLGDYLKDYVYKHIKKG